MTRSQFLTAGATVFSSLVAGGRLASAHQDKIDKEKLEYFETQEIPVEDFPSSGHILDIGGGGEGVIGQLKGREVVAIDLSKRELEGAPAGPLKIVMDATELKFLDGSFETVTAFYSFMYMPPEVREKALLEIHRVLTPGGRFLLWEPIVPAQTDPKKEIAVFRFVFKLPGREVRTGYGTPYRNYRRDMDYHNGFARKAGFEIVRSQAWKQSFFVEYRSGGTPETPHVPRPAGAGLRLPASETTHASRAHSAPAAFG